MKHKCINCNYFMSCKYTDENKDYCEYFVKAIREIIHLDNKED